MSYKHPNSRYRYGRFKRPLTGRWTYRSTGATKKAKADAIERQWRVEAEETRRKGYLSSGSLGQLMALYMQATEDKASGDRDAYSGEHLLQFFGSEMAVDTIKPSDVSRYREARLKSVTPGTYNREVSLLSVLMNYGKRELDWKLDRNPCEGKRLPEPKTKLTTLTYSDAAKMIGAVNQQAPHTVDLIDLGCQTGCRKNELLQLEWQRVDFKRNEIILRAEDTKTAKPRRVPMNEAARVVLLRRARIRAEICPDTPWVFFHVRRVRNKEIGDRIGDVKRSIKSAARRVGLEGVTFHTLRHTCASWLGQEGIGSLTIRDILGHTSIRTTDRYLHSQGQQLHQAVAALRSINR